MAHRLKDHKNLTVFKQHGFIYKGESGNQVYGYSIFSGKDNFWINPEKKTWDCKNTGYEGGYAKFLQCVHEMSVKSLNGLPLSKLRKSRGLQRNTFTSHKVGYNPSNDTYVIPIYDANNDKIWDLKIFNPKAKKNNMFGTAGGSVGLYGWDELSAAKTIWLVEGEWDKMAMWEILYNMKKLGDETVVSAPGALTFKTDWPQLFKDKDVICAYDKDDPKTVNGILRPGAGPKGTMKVSKLIKNVTKSLNFVHWPKNKKDGYDVRDLLVENKSHAKTYKIMKSLLKPEPTLEEEFRNEQDYDDKSDEEILTGPRIPAKKVYDGYKKWLYLPDTSVLDVMFGCVLANRLDGDPIWLFLVAPSGATKTELLLTISEAPKVTTTTTLTPHSLVSGANYAGGGDPSLIPRLNNKILIIKDITTILDMNQTARQEIFGILRDAYDGKTEKMFGNGVFRSYKSKFGILAGSTHVIELFTEGQTALGERFLRYIIDVPNSYKERFKYLKRASENVHNTQQMRDELRDLGSKVLSHNYTNIPEISDDIQEKLIILAQWTSTMRGTVIREQFTKEIVASPFSELGTRLIKQFTKLSIGISQFKGLRKVNNIVYNTIRNVAISSVPSDLNKICYYLCTVKNSKWTSQKDIFTMTKLPMDNCRRKLENMVLLNVLEKRKIQNMFEYRIKPDLYEMMEDAGIYA